MGAFARTADNLAAVYEALQYTDPRDHACAQRGFDAAHRRIGASVRCVSRGAAFLITAAEGGQLHMDDLRARYGKHEPLSRDRLIAGALLPAASIMQAQRVRAALRRRVLELFERHDVLIVPATPIVAPRIGNEFMQVNGDTLAVRANLGMLTQPVSCLGLPVVAVPMRTASGLPIAVQLIAPPWREDLAFEAARCLERLEEAHAAHCPPPSFRAARPGAGPERTVTARVVTTYGDACAVANIKFRRTGEPRIGRQSQTWVKMPEGWRVVSAHVSWMEA